jgi:hypothetical protein
MSEDQFTKMFKYMQDEFKTAGQDRLEMKNMIIDLQGSVDAYAKQVLEITQEHLMLGRKVDRIEQWVQQIASVSGIKLEY